MIIRFPAVEMYKKLQFKIANLKKKSLLSYQFLVKGFDGTVVNWTTHSINENIKITLTCNFHV